MVLPREPEHRAKPYQQIQQASKCLLLIQNGHSTMLNDVRFWG